MYLALDGGPPCFPLGSSCPVVLWIPARLSLFRVRGSHSLCRTFPDASTKVSGLLQVRNPKKPKSLGLGSSRFARRYSGSLTRSTHEFAGQSACLGFLPLRCHRLP